MSAAPALVVASAPGPSAFEVAGVLVAAAGALLYAAGVLRMRHVATGFVVGRGRTLACGAGFLVLAAGLGPPVAGLADVLFSVHMGQHELLMLVAPPLLVLGRPLVVFLWALPRPLRAVLAARARHPVVRRVWRGATTPVTVLLLHAAVLWSWHLPSAFEAALANETLHALQHVSFFAAAALFWWTLVHGRFGRLGWGVGVLFVFATALHSGALGALLTVASAPLYPTHAARAAAHGVSAIEDQQLAGLLMWIPAGVLLLVSALAMFAAWLAVAARRIRHTRAARLLAQPGGER